MENINVPVRETEVNRVMSNLSEAMEWLAQSVEATEVRLAGITRGEWTGVGMEKRNKPAEPEYYTQLAQNINEIHDRVLKLRERLDSLLDRLEI